MGVTRNRSIVRGSLSAVLSGIALSDVLALVAVGLALYGLSILHPAAPWIGGGVACALVSIELAKRESARAKEE
jgi:hypothetical protein